MLFDPIYWVVIGVGLVLNLWAAAKVKGSFAKYSKYSNRLGLTGADVAYRILEDEGISGVKVEPVGGHLSDHYDPRTRTLRLSESVYGSQSLAALGVAAHEVGHAIQHARAYAPLKFRSAWVPVAGFASNFSMLFIIGGFFLGMKPLAIVGVLLFAAVTLFTLITLPVEFDASKRAIVTLDRGGYLTQEELTGARKVLSAAAMTYVAAFVSSLLTLLYWLHVTGLLGGGDE